MAYAINNWDEHFESAYSRRIKGRLPWVQMPTSHDGKRYLRLTSRPMPVELFGAWCLLVELAARMPKRGLFVDSHGEALDAQDFADMTKMPVEPFERALKELASPRLRWIIGNGETLFDSAPDEPEQADAPAPAPDPAPDPDTPKTEKRTIRWGTVEGFTGITDADRERWTKAYPACDLDRQLAQMDDWLRANPAKARKSNWASFVGRWLSRAQDRGGDAGPGRSAARGASPIKADADNVDPRDCMI